MTQILQVFYIVFSALMLSAGIPNEFLSFGSPILGLFSLVPFYIALTRSKSFKNAGFLCSLEFSLVQLFSSYWLGNFKDFAVFTVGGPILAYFVFGQAFGRFFYFVLKYKSRQTAGLLRRIFLFAAVYTLWEWQKSIGFLAYPWGTLFLSVYKWRLFYQIFDITGTWAVSFLFSLFSALVAEGILLIPSAKTEENCAAASLYAKTAIFIFLIFGANICYGIFQYTKVRQPVKFVKTVLVQQNADSWVTGGEDDSVTISQKLSRQGIDQSIAQFGQKPDLICWSEAVLNYAFPNATGFYQFYPPENPLIPFISSTDTPFVIGAPVQVGSEPALFENGAVVFNGDATVQGYYGKMHLVPFAEYIPFTEYEWFCKIMDKLVGFSSGWHPGTKFSTFTVPVENGKNTLTFSVPICFEDAFADVCRGLWHAGSEVLMNITNDSWSRTNSAEYQHFVVASYRAIELRTTLVRSTNAGYSVVVDPAGKILADMPLFEEAVKCVDVPVYEHSETFYARYGDWFCWLMLALSLAAFAVMVTKTKVKDLNIF